MPDLADFLLARIAEDEARVVVMECHCDDAPVRWPDCPDRVLAECEAKRRIVEHCEPDLMTLSPGDPHVLRLLAAVYADHPDYREKWKP